MDQSARHLLRHRLNLVGWGFLLYLIVAQVLSVALLYLPGADSSETVSTLVSYGGIYLLAPTVLWLFLRKLPRGKAPALAFSPKAFLRTAVVCVGTAYLFNFLTLMLMELLERATGLATGNILESAQDSIPPALYLLLVGLIAPVCEELIFRRLLLDRLRPFGDRFAILASALAFGLFHLNLYQLFYATALGILFAGVVVKTGKLRHSIALHATVNLFFYAVARLVEIDALSDGVVYAILASCAMGLYWLARYAPTYRFAPPESPVSDAQVFSGLLRCPGVWLCVLISLAASTLMVFL